MRRYILLCFVALFLIQGCASKPQTQQPVVYIKPLTIDDKLNELAIQIIEQLAVQETLKIAIIPFTNERKEISEFAVSIVEPISFRLDRSGRFEQVARGEALDNILKEYGLWNEWFIEPSYNKLKNEKYRILGLDGFVYGVISDWGNNIKLNCDLFSYKNGESIAKAEVTMVKTSTIRGKMSRIVPMTSLPQPTHNISTSGSISKTVNVGNAYFIFSRQSLDIYNCVISNRNNFTVNIKVTKSAGTDYFGEKLFDPVFDINLKDGQSISKEKLFLKMGDNIHIKIKGKNYVRQESFTL